MADFNENLRIQEQINKVLKERIKLFEKHAQAANDQLSTLTEIQESIDKGTFEKVTDQFSELTNAMKKAATMGVTLGRTLGSVFTGLARKIASIATLPLRAFQGIWDISKSLTSSLFGVTKSIFSISKALLSIPTSVFRGMNIAAADLFVSMQGIMIAWEGVRRNIGDLVVDTGAAAKALVDNAGGLSVTGLGTSLYTWFKDSGAAAAYFGETIKALGPVGSLLSEQLSKIDSTFFIGFEKAFNDGGEGIKALGERAIALGEPLTVAMKQISKFATIAQKQFGFSAKFIGHDITKMISDVSHFGNMSIEELGQVAAEARGLGIGVKDLGGVIDNFLFFDKAAISASRLSQAFGVMVDPLKLMREAGKGGIGVIKELRKQFFRAGLSAEKLSLAELRALSSTTGLSAETIKYALAQENRGISDEKLAAGMEKIAEANKSESDLLRDLIGHTEQYIRIMQPADTLFGTFVQGFKKGTSFGNEWMKTLMELAKVQQLVSWTGFEVGKIFMDTFPGIVDMLKGFQKAFNEKVFAEPMERIKDAFAGLFSALSDPKKAKDSIKRFSTNVRGAFKEIFNPRSAALKQFAKGGSDFMMALSRGVASGIKFLYEQFQIGLDKVIDFLKNPSGFIRKFENTATDAFEKGGEASGTAFIMSFISPIADQLKEIWNNDETKTKIKEGISSLLDLVLEGLDAVDKELNAPAGKIGAKLKLVGMKLISMFKDHVIVPLGKHILKSLKEAILDGLEQGIKALPGGGAVFKKLEETFAANAEPTHELVPAYATQLEAGQLFVSDPATGEKTPYYATADKGALNSPIHLEIKLDSGAIADIILTPEQLRRRKIAIVANQ